MPPAPADGSTPPGADVCPAPGVAPSGAAVDPVVVADGPDGLDGPDDATATGEPSGWVGSGSRLTAGALATGWALGPGPWVVPGFAVPCGGPDVGGAEVGEATIATATQRPVPDR